MHQHWWPIRKAERSSTWSPVRMTDALLTQYMMLLGILRKGCKHITSSGHGPCNILRVEWNLWQLVPLD